MKKKNSKVIRFKDLVDESTARQVHGSSSYVPAPPRRGPRTARPPRRVYESLRRWLRAWTVAPGAAWVSIGRLADMATRDLDMPVYKSTLGYVIQKEYPGIPMRTVSRKYGDLIEVTRSQVEYDMRFLTGPLDDADESC